MTKYYINCTHDFDDAYGDMMAAGPLSEAIAFGPLTENDPHATAYFSSPEAAESALTNVLRNFNTHGCSLSIEQADD